MVKKQIKNKISFNEMMRHKKLQTYSENQCICNAETKEECTCGKFVEVKE